MQNEHVRYSRAGDKFHYRWAARRCLLMIHPSSEVQFITVEGSDESEGGGEYVIDLAEYTLTSVTYYQLKHSSVRIKQPFSLSELSSTLSGFAARFKDGWGAQYTQREFVFVSNRPVSDALKTIIGAAAQGTQVAGPSARLETITGLRGSALEAFLSMLRIADNEGDYLEQKRQLAEEVAQIAPRLVGSPNEDSLVGLVEDRAMPCSEEPGRDHRIYREDVWRRLQVTSQRDLFPAPLLFEPLDNTFPREVEGDLVSSIRTAGGPLIIHASGGVGKTIVARHCMTYFSRPSKGLIYDCFGGGKYRNESEPRHRPSEALLQIANELAAEGLCHFLVLRPDAPRQVVFREFLERVREACERIAARDSSGVLVLLVDAADNAEMVAKELGEISFAKPLLRETFPDNFRLVLLCRSERIELLDPPSYVGLRELHPFTESESARHLRRHFAGASDADAKEFHRLTAGNPRVQANVLMHRAPSVQAMLAALGPDVLEVDKQIGNLLEAAVSRLRDGKTLIERSQVDAICAGLANLPPYIPVQVLARVANVHPSTVLSFVSDLGRPLWNPGDFVQFRDEPTETWFRQRFAADREALKAFSATLEPLSVESVYAAKALPRIWFGSSQEEKLIKAALSDELLPTTSPLQQREVRVYRLQFAFNAALKAKRYVDACRIAFRAGEEKAGNQRQHSFLAEHIVHFAHLSETTQIQDYAYRRLLKAGWEGSENAFSAVLLAEVRDFRGEAQSYLRSAMRWADIHAAEARKQTKRLAIPAQGVQPEEWADLAWAHYRLFGPVEMVRYVLRIKEGALTRFHMAYVICARLVDFQEWSHLETVCNAGAKSPMFVLGCCQALIEVGRFPPPECVLVALNALKKQAPRKVDGQRRGTDRLFEAAFVSFAESCAHHQVSREAALAILDTHVGPLRSSDITELHYRHLRVNALRAAALRAVLLGRKEIRLCEPLAGGSLPEGSRGEVEAGKEAEEYCSCFGPLYLARARAIIGTMSDDLHALYTRAGAYSPARYHQFDPVPAELLRIYFECVSFHGAIGVNQLADVLARKGTVWPLEDRVVATRIANRLSHMQPVSAIVEQLAAAMLREEGVESPEESSNWFAALSKAVLPSSKADSHAYFEAGVRTLSRFGDEIVHRWDAVVSCSLRGCERDRASAEFAYRFLRAAEAVGESVTREKYWSREEAIRAAIKMNVGAGLAGLTRWRERDIGWFDELLPKAACELISATHSLQPLDVWALSGFLACAKSVELLEAILGTSSIGESKEMVFEAAIHNLKVNGAYEKAADTIRRLAAQHGLSMAGADCATGAIPLEVVLPVQTDTGAEDDLGSLPFDQIAPLERGSLAAVLEWRASSEIRGRVPQLWDRLMDRVPRGREIDFLDLLLTLSEFDFYDFRSVYDAVHRKWMNTAAVRQRWLTYLEACGRRFYLSIIHGYRHKHWYGWRFAPDELAWLLSGGHQALSDAPSFLSADGFFGFVETAVDKLAESDALQVAEFALGRIELHIGEGFGDGPWNSGLAGSSNDFRAFAGFIWSALGSPESSVRWQGVHAVRTLLVNQRSAVVAALWDWFDAGTDAEFAVPGYPFYVLHAELFLLVGLARAALEAPKAISPYVGRLIDIMRHGRQHAVMRYFAATALLSSHAPDQDSLSEEFLAELRAACWDGMIGEMPSEGTWCSGEQRRSFAYDFAEYWFPPIAEVFGISVEEVMAIAFECAKENGIALGLSEVERDPRSERWRRLSQHGRGTYHHHSDYPYVHDLQFYASMHALFFAARRLHHRASKSAATAPVDPEHERCSWSDWLRRHLLTRADDRWLADRRDPTPVRSRAWPNLYGEEWIVSIDRSLFLQIVTTDVPRSGWLCVHGSWHDCEHSRIEDVSISSSFAPRESIESLADALESHDDPSRAWLPDSGGDSGGVAPFQLKPLVQRAPYVDAGIDQFDPHARELRYPPMALAEAIAQQFTLRTDAERRAWSIADTCGPVAITEAWSDKPLDRRGEDFREGERVSVDPQWLEQACQLLGMDFLICVRVRRRLPNSYQRDTRGAGFVPYSHRLFIFTNDGRIRATP